MQAQMYLANPLGDLTPEGGQATRKVRSNNDKIPRTHSMGTNRAWTFWFSKAGHQAWDLSAQCHFCALYTLFWCLFLHCLKQVSLGKGAKHTKWGGHFRPFLASLVNSLTKRGVSRARYPGLMPLLHLLTRQWQVHRTLNLPRQGCLSSTIGCEPAEKDVSKCLRQPYI